MVTPESPRDRPVVLRYCGIMLPQFSEDVLSRARAAFNAVMVETNYFEDGFPGDGIVDDMLASILACTLPYPHHGYVTAMSESPMMPYGFVYEYSGKRFAFHIVASSREEAEARLVEMRRAECVGALSESVPAHD